MARVRAGVVAVVVIATVILVLQRAVISPWKANADVGLALRRTVEVHRVPDTAIGQQTIAANIELLGRAVKANPYDPQTRFLFASNLILSEDTEAALREYDAIVAFEERPEVQVAAAELELQERDTAKAIDRYLRACSFSPHYFDEIGDPRVRAAVQMSLSRE